MTKQTKMPVYLLLNVQFLINTFYTWRVTYMCRLSIGCTAATLGFFLNEINYTKYVYSKWFYLNVGCGGTYKVLLVFRYPLRYEIERTFVRPHFDAKHDLSHCEHTFTFLLPLSYRVLAVINF